MFDNIVKDIHRIKPLVHCITNYVSINDCANILLASGGAAIMAEDAHEVEEITSLCNGLNINIGMINDNKLKSMLLVGKKANELNHPVVLDPVGAGASEFRTQAALKIISNIRLAAIRGNISEMKAIAGAVSDKGSSNGNKLYHTESKGVEVSDIDRINGDNLPDVVDFAAGLAKKLDTVICMTGKIDIVTNGRTVYCIRNGNPLMSKVTGEGCQLSALTTAYITTAHSIMENDDTMKNDKIMENDNIIKNDNVMEDNNVMENNNIMKNDNDTLEIYVRAAAAAVCVMGVSGEIAYDRMSEPDGNASYRNYIIDAVYNMTDEILEDRCRVEVMNYE